MLGKYPVLYNLSCRGHLPASCFCLVFGVALAAYLHAFIGVGGLEGALIKMVFPDFSRCVCTYEVRSYAFYSALERAVELYIDHRSSVDTPIVRSPFRAV